MKRSLLNLIGTSLIGLTALGCAGSKSRTQCHPLTLEPPVISIPAEKDPASLPAEPKNEAETKENNSSNWKLGAYSSERFGDMVLSSGYHVGEFPALTNDTGVTLENGRFSMTGWRFSVYSKGRNVEED